MFEFLKSWNGLTKDCSALKAYRKLSNIGSRYEGIPSVVLKHSKT